LVRNRRIHSAKNFLPTKTIGSDNDHIFCFLLRERKINVGKKNKKKEKRNFVFFHFNDFRFKNALLSPLVQP
jgi:hypothetical protein